MNFLSVNARDSTRNKSSKDWYLIPKNKFIILAATTALLSVILYFTGLFVVLAEKKAIEDSYYNTESESSKEEKIRANKYNINDLLVILLDNAIKYSPAESTIQISARGAEKEVIIAVKDSGCGIDKSHLSRIFERFYVVDKARTRKLGGTGLGLAIVKHIVQLHGGSVAVESSPGQGSTFTIHLPIR